MNFDDFLMVKIMKKVDIMKKFRFFPKVKVMIGTVTKYELLTPRELEDIQNLAKTFLFRKKKFSVNSSSFLFKGIIRGPHFQVRGSVVKGRP